MTYGQAIKDFVLFAVFAPVKNKKGKVKLDEVDLEEKYIPYDAEGKVAAFDLNEGLLTTSRPRLCFILNEEVR